MLSHVQLFVTPWSVAHQAPLSMGFSRQEYWSGLPGILPRDRHDPGIELTSLHLLHWQVDSLPLSHLRSPILSIKVKESEGVQSCPTLCDPIECSPPGSSVHGIFQVRMLEPVAMPSSRGSSQPMDQTHISCVSGHVGALFATEPQGKPLFLFRKNI